jgi:hypothetical protein
MKTLTHKQASSLEEFFGEIPASDLGWHLNPSEIEVWVNMLLEFGQEDTARDLVESHFQDCDEGDIDALKDSGTLKKVSLTKKEAIERMKEFQR